MMDPETPPRLIETAIFSAASPIVSEFAEAGPHSS